MGLIECPECNGKVSDIALACPHCGRPFVEQNDTLPTQENPGTSGSPALVLPTNETVSCPDCGTQLNNPADGKCPQCRRPVEFIMEANRFAKAQKPIWIRKGAEQLGPYTAYQVRIKIEDGSLSASDWAWYEGLDNWIPAIELNRVDYTKQEKEVRPPVAALPDNLPKSPPINRQILVSKDGANIGPLNIEQVNQMTAIGTFSSSDMSWHKGLIGWVKLNQLEGFNSTKPSIKPEWNMDDQQEEDASKSSFFGGCSSQAVIPIVIIAILIIAKSFLLRACFTPTRYQLSPPSQIE